MSAGSGSPGVGWNALALGGAGAAARVLAFVSLVLVARALSHGELGLLSVALAVGALAFEAGEGGLDPMAVRALARGGRSEPERLGAALAAKVAYTLPGLVLALGGFALVYPVPEERFAATAVVGGAWVGGLGRTLSCLFQARERFAHRGALDLVRAAALAVGSAIVVASVPRGRALVPVGGVYAVAEVAVFVTAVIMNVRSFGAVRPRLRLRSAVVLARQALWPAVASFLGVSYLVGDRLFLEAFGYREELGAYEAVGRLVVGLALIPGALARASLPAFAGRDVERARTLYTSSLRVLGAMGIPCAIGGAAIGPALAGWLFGPDYEEASRPFAWLCFLGGGAIFLSYVSGTALLALGETRTLARITGALALANVIGNLLLVPPLGAVGAAGVMAATQIGAVVTFGIAVEPRLGAVRSVEWGRPLVAAVLSGAAAWAWPGHVALAVAVGAGVYAVALAAMRAIPLDDLRRLRES